MKNSELTRARVNGKNKHVATFNYNGFWGENIANTRFQNTVERELVKLVKLSVEAVNIKKVPLINICLLDIRQTAFRTGKATKNNYGLMVYMPFLGIKEYKTLHLSVRISDCQENNVDFDKATRRLIIEKLKELFEQHYAQ